MEANMETYEPHKDNERYGNVIKFRHSTLTPLRASRLRCVDCCAGGVSAARNCECGTDGVHRACPLWPFRMGKKAIGAGSRVKVVADYCVWCKGDHESSRVWVKECDDRTCPLLQYRFGKDPKRTRPMSENFKAARAANREVRIANLKRINHVRRNARKNSCAIVEEPRETTKLPNTGLNTADG